MKTYTIIWDFDGTILPLDPYDSEQFLLKEKADNPSTPFFTKLVANLVVYADQKQLMRKSFKKHFYNIMKGTSVDVLENACRKMSEKISAEDRDVYRSLKERGHKMMILSCGTLDLSERVLKFAGIRDCFESITASHFTIDGDIISGVKQVIKNPNEKLLHASHLSPENTIVVGDGYTDIPLLDWAGVPILLDRDGSKRDKHKNKGYNIISKVSEVTDLINQTAQ